MQHPVSFPGASTSLRSTNAIRLGLLFLLLLTTCLLCSGTNPAPITLTSAPTITISPAYAPPGTNIYIWGSGFDPSSNVDLYFDVIHLTTVTTNGAGTFGGGSLHSGLAVQLPASATPGHHWIIAFERSGQKLARKQFLVRTDWAQFHFDVGHSGLNPYENVLSPANVGGLQPAWSYRTGGPVGSPVVTNGVLYFGSRDGNLYALDATTGALLWTYTTGGAIYSSPAVANGVVYVSSGNLYALNATTGTLLWTFTGGGGAPTVANGVVYLGCGLYVCAVNAGTGALLWQYTNAEGVGDDIAVDAGYVYFGSEDPNNWNQGTLFALDAGTGALLWSHVVGNSQNGYVGFSGPAVGGGGVLINVMTNSSQMVFGSLWCFGQDGGMWWQDGLNAPASAPAVANGSVYDGAAANSQGRRQWPATLYAMGMGGGILWQYLPNGNPGSPAVANGAVYFGTSSSLYALNAATGTFLWQYAVADASSPVIANGLVYAGSSDGNIYAFSLTGGGGGK